MIPKILYDSIWFYIILYNYIYIRFHIIIYDSVKYESSKYIILYNS